jgi:plastocyanin
MTHVRFRALAVAMVLAATAAMNSAFAAGETSIAIDNFTFAPAEVAVKAGTKVLFVSHDDIPIWSFSRTARSVRGRWIRTTASPSSSTSRGEFIYFCGLHPQMKGKIIVTP